MKKFKYPLSIRGNKEELESLIPKLEKLGYNKTEYDHDSSIKYLLTCFAGENGRLDYNQNKDSCNESIVVSASNPELVLALAACVDSDGFYEGEYVYLQYSGQHCHGKEDFKDSTFWDKPFKVGYVMQNKFTNPSGKEESSPGRKYSCFWRNGKPIVFSADGTTEYIKRKATKSEILNHFNMKKIIGYKLKEDCKQFEKAAVKLVQTKCYNQTATTFAELDLDESPRYSFYNNSLCAEILSGAGVLDLWFEPVYEEQKKVIHLRYNESSSNGGEFEIEVSKDGIYYAPDDVFLNVADLRRAVEPIKVSKKKGNSSAGEYAFKPTHIDSGCKKGVPVEDWVKVLNAYDEVRGSSSNSRTISTSCSVTGNYDNLIINDPF